MTNAQKTAVVSLVVLCVVAIVFFIVTGSNGNGEDDPQTDELALNGEEDRPDEAAGQDQQRDRPDREVQQDQPREDDADAGDRDNDLDAATFHIGDNDEDQDDQADRLRQEAEQRRQAERQAEQERRQQRQRELEQQREADRQRRVEQRQQEIEQEYEQHTEYILTALRDADRADRDRPDQAEAEPQRQQTQAPQQAAAGADREVPETYTVESGDTLGGIAHRFYGSARHYQAIADHNDIDDPRRIRLGQTLRLPPYDEVVSREAQARQQRRADQQARDQTRHAAQPQEGATTYTVRENDRLWTIAERHYDGMGVHWRRIFEANRDQLDSPDDLRPGMELVIPPKPDDMP